MTRPDDLARADSGGDSILAGIEKRTGSTIRVQLVSSADDRTPVVKLTAPESADGEAPIVASRYRIEGEIARGGVGVVYKAKDIDLGRDVALKVLHERFNERDDILQRFVEEAQIGGQLQHPGIVPVYEIGVCEDRRPFIAMKLVKGETLAAQLARRGSPVEDRLRLLGVFAQVCHTVAYAHARRVVHRDLKPSNVMVGAFGEVQIVDWGFAKVLGAGGVDDEAQSAKARSDQSFVETLRSQSRGTDVGTDSQVGSAIGTPAYMPPEQARGAIDDMDARSDVFALGAVLCEILTGAPPYVRRDYTDESDELLVQASQCRLTDAEHRLRECDADESLVALCRECLSPARHSRPGDAGGVAERITDYLTHVDERARAAEVAAASAKVRARWSHALAASVLVTVSLAIGGWLWIRAESEQRMQRDRKEYAASIAAATERRTRAERGDGDPVGLLEKALDAARRARERAETGGLGEDFVAEADALVARIERERRDAERRRAERRLLAALAELRIPKDEDLRDIRWVRRGMRLLDSGYATTLREFGADVDELAPADAAARLTGSYDEEIAAALDHWSLIRRSLSRPGPQRGSSDNSTAIGDWRRVQRVARLLDPDDAWRNDLRDCLASATVPDLEAVRALQEAADFARMPSVSVILLSAVLVAVGEDEPALDVLRRGQQHHPQDFDLNLRLGLQLERADPPRWHEAAQYYTAAMSIRPGMAAVALRLAYVTDQAGDPTQSFAWRERAHELDPNLAEANAALGAELVRRGDAKAAIYYLSKGVEMAPDNPVAHLRMAQALECEGNLDGAIRHFEQATKLHESYLRAELGLGQALRQSGREKEAVAVFQRIASDSDQIQEMKRIGVTVVASADSKSNDRSRAAFEAVMQALAQRDPGGLVELADEMFAARGFASAISAYSAAFTRDPDLCTGDVRLRAACAAAMAGRGKGRNASFAPQILWPVLRGQSHRWMRAALIDPATDREALRAWRVEPCLAGVREETALAELPEPEAGLWRAFWRDVDARLGT